MYIVVTEGAGLPPNHPYLYFVTAEVLVIVLVSCAHMTIWSTWVTVVVDVLVPTHANGISVDTHV